MQKRHNWSKIKNLWHYFLFLPVLLFTLICLGIINSLFSASYWQHFGHDIPLYGRVVLSTVVFIPIWTMSTSLILLFGILKYFHQIPRNEKLWMLAVNIGVLFLPYVLFFGSLVVNDFQKQLTRQQFQRNVEIKNITYRPVDTDDNSIQDSLAVDLTISAAQEVKNVFIWLNTTCYQLDNVKDSRDSEQWITNAADFQSKMRYTLQKGTHVYTRIITFTQSSTVNTQMYSFSPSLDLEIRIGLNGQELQPIITQVQPTDISPYQFQRDISNGSMCLLERLPMK